MLRRRANHLKYFPNPYDDFDERKQNAIGEHGKLQPEYLERIQIVSEVMLRILTNSIGEMDSSDLSIYSGKSGVALLYLLLAKTHKSLNFVEVGLDIVKKYFHNEENKCASFLCGICGPLTLGAVMYRKLGKVEESEELIQRILDMLQLVCEKPKLSNDIFCGRAGYLYSLLYINKNIGSLPVDSSSIKDVVSAMLQSGKRGAMNENCKIPLMYKWYNECYLGAAHGMAGILYTLLQARNYMSQSDLQELLKPTITCLQEMSLSNGNYSPVISMANDNYVQWCHGAAGMVDLFALAYRVFKEDSYLRSALRCGEIVWNQGLLKKGYGLCHGVAGNAYAFLTLYNITKNPVHLYRACKFAEWCFTYGKYQCGYPEAHLSLFEGLAGTTYFLFDLQEPEKALFPAFAL